MKALSRTLVVFAPFFSLLVPSLFTGTSLAQQVGTQDLKRDLQELDRAVPGTEEQSRKSLEIFGESTVSALKGRYETLLKELDSWGQDLDLSRSRAVDIAAERGNANAQRGLGHAYERGRGVPKDYQQALRWYQKAAEKGEESAQYLLGRLYEHGRGTAKNYERAFEAYRQAAGKDNRAQYRLGRMYHYGLERLV